MRGGPQQYRIRSIGILCVRKCKVLKLFAQDCRLGLSMGLTIPPCYNEKPGVSLSYRVTSEPDLTKINFVLHLLSWKLLKCQFLKENEEKEILKFQHCPAKQPSFITG